MVKLLRLGDSKKVVAILIVIAKKPEGFHSSFLREERETRKAFPFRVPI